MKCWWYQFDDEGWYMIFTYTSLWYMIRLWISKPTQMFNLKSGVFPWGGPYRGEVKSTQFEGFLNAWKPGVWRNSFVKTPPVWGLPFWLLCTNHQKIGFWFAPSNSMSAGMGSVIRKVCPIWKSCRFNNRWQVLIYTCFPTHPQAPFHSVFFRAVSKRIELDVPAFVAHSRLPNISLIGPGIMISVQKFSTGSDMTID